MQRGQPRDFGGQTKKVFVGPYKTRARAAHKGGPERVDVHDFPDPELGKVIPYGEFDLLSRDEGWGSVGLAQFACQHRPVVAAVQSKILAVAPPL